MKTASNTLSVSKKGTSVNKQLKTYLKQQSITSL
ncbi:hypothetical protein ABIB50_000183 [Mucilaginibacter sp. UYCu711]